MNIIRKAVTTLAGIFLAVLLIAALAPKATRGVVAALVQVTNTTANPVPTVAAEALNSFDVNGHCEFIPSDFNAFLHNDFCLIDPIYTVPSGKIAVVERVSGRCITDVKTGLREARLRVGNSVDLSGTGPSQFSFLMPGPQLSFFDANEIETFAQNIKTYAAASTPINIDIFATTIQTSDFDQCLVDISGYLVSQ
jgi:hypothetical protein